MLKIRMSDGTLIVGIDASNIDKLKDKKPMVIKHEDIGDTTGDILVVYGETLEDVVKELRGAGCPIPENLVIPS